MKGLRNTGSRTAHVAIVLDRSGSMEVARDATIRGFNEYVEGVRETAEREELTVKVTLTVFSGEVDTRFVDAPIAHLKKLSRRTYAPSGSTAMLDAVGETIDRLRAVGHEADDSFLVCVISDGEENASERYSYADVAERVQQQMKTGRWTFTYLGSNQDLSQVSRDLHIPAGNVAAYVADAAGTGDAWRTHRARSARLFESIARNEPAPASFYAEDPRDEEETL